MPLVFAGITAAANYPVPIIGSDRFLNITARRPDAMLDAGVMSDVVRLPNAQAIANRVAAALALWEAQDGA